MSQRIDRVDELLRQEIGAILEREVSDPRIGFVTVTRVEASPDLAHARVWVSIIGTPGERTASLRALEHAMPYVRRALGSRIRIKRIPALHVHLDASIEKGARVLKLIDEIGAGRTGDPLAPDADVVPKESLPTPTRRRAQPGDAPDDPSAEDAPGHTKAPEHTAGHARADAKGEPHRTRKGSPRPGAGRGSGSRGGRRAHGTGAR